MVTDALLVVVVMFVSFAIFSADAVPLSKTRMVRVARRIVI